MIRFEKKYHTIVNHLHVCQCIEYISYAGTAYTSGAPGFTPGFSGFMFLDFLLSV
jgi:hypothetical protein